MKKTIIRRMIMRETETLVLKTTGAKPGDAEKQPHVCPLCNSPIQPKQIAAAPQADKLLLPKES